jgi:predicted metal-dependent HD superfamily phosphohydrolase
MAERYEDTHRHFHRTEHILAVLDGAQRIAASLTLDWPQKAALALAACAHDVIYEARPGDDERASADWARRHLSRSRVPERSIELVAQLVLATLTHQMEEPDAATAALLDADLSILGAHPWIYDKYVKDVRAEYRAVADDLWALGRGQALSGLADRTHIYITPLARQWWEQPARENIARELAVLQAS